jgi:hypothetical protein
MIQGLVSYIFKCIKTLRFSKLHDCICLNGKIVFTHLQEKYVLFIVYGTGISTQDLVFGRQASTAGVTPPVHFALIIFGMEVSPTICPGWL